MSSLAEWQTAHARAKREALELAMLDAIRAVGLPEPVREYRFAPPRRWRFDFAWPAAKVAVEVEGGTHDGGRHVRGKGYAADAEKYNAAIAHGWRVFRWARGLRMMEIAEQAAACVTLDGCE